MPDLDVLTSMQVLQISTVPLLSVRVDKYDLVYMLVVTLHGHTTYIIMLLK